MWRDDTTRVIVNAYGRIKDGDIVIAVVFVSRGAARLRDVIWRPS
jgi:hypothetical protein